MYGVRTHATRVRFSIPAQLANVLGSSEETERDYGHGAESAASATGTTTVQARSEERREEEIRARAGVRCMIVRRRVVIDTSSLRKY